MRIKVLKIILVSLIIVGLCSIVVLSIYYYHNYKRPNFLPRSVKSNVNVTTFTSSTESQGQKQKEAAKNYRLFLSEQLKKGNVDAAATIGPTKEVEDYILTTLQSDNWFAGAGMIQGLLSGYKWPPDRFSMKIRDALVDILERELAKQKPPYRIGREGGEMDVLTQDVCALYNPRAISLLIKLNMIGCLSIYGDTGAGIVLSTTAFLWTQTASTKLEAYKLSDKKVYAMMSLGAFTEHHSRWNSLSPDIQNKIKDTIYDGLKDKDWGVRVWAIKALVPIADRKDVPLLKKLYEDHEKVGTVYPVHEEAQKALTQRPFLWDLLDKETQNRIRDDIYNKLKDKDWGVKLEAVKELAPIANKNDIPLLKKLSEDPVSYVSKEAQKALEELKTKGIKP